MLKQRLVNLNHHRAAEEASGHIRYLRPDYQNPEAHREKQAEFLTTKDTKSTKKKTDLSKTLSLSKGDRQPWPKTLPEQIRAVRTVIENLPPTANTALVAKCFRGARKVKVEEILGVLDVLGT